MNISAKNFIASQALYGLMISKPNMGTRKMVRKAYKIAKRMIRKGGDCG